MARDLRNTKTEQTRLHAASRRASTAAERGLTICAIGIGFGAALINQGSIYLLPLAVIMIGVSALAMIGILVWDFQVQGKLRHELTELLLPSDDSQHH